MDAITGAGGGDGGTWVGGTGACELTGRGVIATVAGFAGDGDGDGAGVSTGTESCTGTGDVADVAVCTTAVTISGFVAGTDAVASGPGSSRRGSCNCVVDIFNAGA